MWKCSKCETFNEDMDEQCYVCGFDHNASMYLSSLTSPKPFDPPHSISNPANTQPVHPGGNKGGPSTAPKPSKSEETKEIKRTHKTSEPPVKSSDERGKIKSNLGSNPPRSSGGETKKTKPGHKPVPTFLIAIIILAIVLIIIALVILIPQGSVSISNQAADIIVPEQIVSEVLV